MKEKLKLFSNFLVGTIFTSSVGLLITVLFHDLLKNWVMETGINNKARTTIINAIEFISSNMYFHISISFLIGCSLTYLLARTYFLHNYELKKNSISRIKLQTKKAYSELSHRMYLTANEIEGKLEYSTQSEIDDAFGPEGHTNLTMTNSLIDLYERIEMLLSCLNSINITVPELKKMQSHYEQLRITSNYLSKITPYIEEYDLKQAKLKAEDFCKTIVVKKTD